MTSGSVQGSILALIGLMLVGRHPDVRLIS